MLVRKGRLALARPVEEWVDAALALPGVTLLPVTSSMALEAARLHDGFPGDPVDRMLVAAARLTGAALVTRDRRILDSGSDGGRRDGPARLRAASERVPGTGGTVPPAD